MTLPTLPPENSNSWYDHYAAIDAAVRAGGGGGGIPTGATAGQTGVKTRSGSVAAVDIEVLVYYDWATTSYPARPDVPRVTWIGPTAPLLTPSGPAEGADYWVEDTVAPPAQTAIRSESYGATASGATWPIVLPADIDAGDTIVVILGSGAVGVNTAIPPAGFTQRANDNRFGNTNAWLFTATATGTEGGTTVVFDNDLVQPAAYYCAALDGVSGTPVVSVAVDSAATIAAPTVVSAADSAVLAVAFGDMRNGDVWATDYPDGAVERAIIASGAPESLTVSGRVVQLDHSAGGTTDAFTWSWVGSTAASRPAVAITAAFAPTA